MATGFMQRFKGKIKAHTVFVGYGGLVRSIVTGLTAAGTNRATALQLTAPVSFVSTASTSTGVILPLAQNAGQDAVVYNDGAQALTVYATGSDTIDGTAGGTGVALTNAKRCRYVAKSISAAGVVTWVSDQLGAVSA